MNDRRPIVIAVLVALVIAAALVAWSWPRGQAPAVASPSPTTTATPTATATAASATPSASPTATAAAGVLDDRFGFYLLPEGYQAATKAVVRSETSAGEVSSFTWLGWSFVNASRAVSPDGRSIAYWGPIKDGAVLRVRAVTGGSDREVLKVASGMFGGVFAWSTDGTGLVVAVDNNCCEFVAGTPVAELWTVDLASGATEKIASRNGGVWLPVAWDRAAAVVGAGTSGPGGFLTGFDVISLAAQPYEVRSAAFQPALCCALGLRASSDGRFVFIRWVGVDVQWWPLREPARRSTIDPSKFPPAWRPGTSEIWWVDGGALISFDVATGARKTAVRGTFGVTLAGFRVDGSVAITEDGSRKVFVELASGRTATIEVGGELREAVRIR